MRTESSSSSSKQFRHEGLEIVKGLLSMGDGSSKSTFDLKLERLKNMIGSFSADGATKSGLLVVFPHVSRCQ